MLSIPTEYLGAVRNIVTFLLLIAGTAILAALSKGIVGRALRHSSPRLVIQAQQYLSGFIWFVGIALAIGQLGLEMNVLLVILAIVGAGILIGMRGVLKSMFSRLFLDFYSQYRVGDEIKIQEYLGKIVEINPLSTVLLTEDEELIMIPNSLFLEDVSINKSARAGLEVTLPIIVDKVIDDVEFEKWVLDVCSKIKGIRKRPKPVVATTKTNEKAKELSLMFTIRNPEDKALVLNEINDRVNKILEEMKETSKVEG